jgi:ABC-type Fe3+/spermidine/putrescine transport system ATPase subunit
MEGIAPADGASAAPPCEETAPVLEVRDLVADYGAETVVDGLDLKIRPGELVTLLGPSGCGKTTSLRCVAGLHRVTSGSITIAGRLMADGRTHVRPERRGLNMVFQSYALWPHMSVFDNVAYGLRAQKVPRTEVSQRTEEMLDVVGLGGFAQRSTSALSGGQQQRVVLARALVTRPTLLLLDEPLSNLDTELRMRMRTEIHRLQRELGLTMLYVTHDRSEALSLSDWVMVMRDGRAQQIGRPRELYASPVNRYVAEALGPVNAFRGRFAADAAAPAAVLTELPSEPRVPVCDPVAGRPAPGADDAIEVLVRPEAMSVEPLGRGDGEEGITATVELIEFLGSRTETTCRAGTRGFTVESTEAPAGVSLGDQVRVRVRRGAELPLPTWRVIGEDE